MRRSQNNENNRCKSDCQLVNFLTLDLTFARKLINVSLTCIHKPLDKCFRWDDENVKDTMAAAAKGYEALDALVSQGDNERNLMPNVAMKHKHVGLRGRDTYGVPHRFGMEFRRGHRSSEELEDLFRYCASTLAGLKIGSDATIRMRRGARAHGPLRGARAHGPGYRMSECVRFVKECRQCPAYALRLAEDVGCDMDKLEQVAERWIKQSAAWDRHRRSVLSAMWLRSGDPQPFSFTDEAFVAKVTPKLQRRLMFLLYTDFSQFPHYDEAELNNVYPEGSPYGDQKVFFQGIQDEQRHIIELIDGLVGMSKLAHWR
eukprot:gene18220-816_t